MKIIIKYINYKHYLIHCVNCCDFIVKQEEFLKDPISLRLSVTCPNCKSKMYFLKDMDEYCDYNIAERLTEEEYKSLEVQPVEQIKRG